jgi:hypothetical protein
LTENGVRTLPHIRPCLVQYDLLDLGFPSELDDRIAELRKSEGETNILEWAGESSSSP